MRHRRLGHRALALAALLTATTFFGPTSAAAFTVYSASIMSSTCSGEVGWRGDIPYDNAWSTQYEQTVGTVKWCYFTYRVSDSDPNGDYYVVAVSVDWKTTYNANGHYPPDQYGKVRISSSVAAINNVRFADPDHSITLNTSCNTSVGFTVAYGVFSVNVTEKFCSGGKLNLETLSNTVAQWGSPDVAKTPHWEVAYMLKVPQGAKPLLIGTLTLPRYNIYRDASTLYWKYTKAWSSLTTSWQVR